MWPEALGPDHWKVIGYRLEMECVEVFSDRASIDTSTGEANYSAKQIYLDLDLYLVGHMSYSAVLGTLLTSLTYMQPLTNTLRV